MMYVDMIVKNVNFGNTSRRYTGFMTTQERAFLFKHWSKRAVSIELWLNGHRVGTFYDGRWIG